MASNTPPHYLRFARAIALVAITGSGAAASGCCPLIPDSVACDHCACASIDRTLSAPLLCDTIHREPICCRHAPVVGPLAPPNLAVA